MEDNKLTKEEAIALMKEGKKLTHRYFSDDEWITMKGNIVVMEDGAEMFAKEFWCYRDNEYWEADWQLFQPNKPTTMNKDKIVESTKKQLHGFRVKRGLRNSYRKFLVEKGRTTEYVDKDIEKLDESIKVFQDIIEKYSNQQQH